MSRSGQDRRATTERRMRPAVTAIGSTSPRSMARRSQVLTGLAAARSGGTVLGVGFGWDGAWVGTRSLCCWSQRTNPSTVVWASSRLSSKTAVRSSAMSAVVAWPSTSDHMAAAVRSRWAAGGPEVLQRSASPDSCKETRSDARSGCGFTVGQRTATLGYSASQSSDHVAVRLDGRGDQTRVVRAGCNTCKANSFLFLLLLQRS